MSEKSISVELATKEENSIKHLFQSIFCAYTIVQPNNNQERYKKDLKQAFIDEFEKLILSRLPVQDEIRMFLITSTEGFKPLLTNIGSTLYEHYVEHYSEDSGPKDNGAIIKIIEKQLNALHVSQANIISYCHRFAQQLEGFIELKPQLKGRGVQLRFSLKQKW